jgi:hypothetical protein
VNYGCIGPDPLVLEAARDAFDSIVERSTGAAAPLLEAAFAYRKA